MPTTPPSDAGSPQTTAAAAVRGREQEMRRVAQRQSSEPQRDQSTRYRQRGREGRSSMFATVGLASVRRVRTRLPAYLSRTRSGVRRISTGELLKLGFEVAQSTVSSAVLLRRRAEGIGWASRN